MATPNKLADLKSSVVATVLNNTRTVTEAAITLNVSRQALYEYMQGRITKHCVYVATGQNDFVAKIVMSPIADSEGQSQ